DLSALRRVAPEEFAYARMGRLVSGWHVANGRTIMLDVRVPKPPPAPAEGAAPPHGVPLLMADLCYSSRAGPPATVHPVRLSEGTWPADSPLEAPTDSAYAVLFRSDWSTWIPLALDTWIACSPHAGAEDTAARLRWMRAHSGAVDRLMARAGDWV